VYCNLKSHLQAVKRVPSIRENSKFSKYFGIIDKYNLALYLALFSYNPKYCYNKPIKRNQMEPSEKYEHLQDGSA
jgi:hypothetical protein